MTTHDGLLARAALKLRQHICGLHGHDSLRHFDNGRMSLLCSSCGHESPGWDVRAAGTSHPASRGTRAPLVQRPVSPVSPVSPLSGADSAGTFAAPSAVTS